MMTPDEYARMIADQLKTAYNNKELAAVRPIFAKADNALTAGKYNAAHKENQE